MMRIIFLGDVVGEPGRLAMYRAVEDLRREFSPALVVVNGENAAGGRGITPRLCREFLDKGVDVITLGDHVWDQPELAGWIDSEPRVLRPHNLQRGTPGKGSVMIPTNHGSIAILNLRGRTFMAPGPENPFTTGMEEAQRLRQAGACAILVDIHAETTSEKIAMAQHLDGRVSAVLGTHTHVQTSDARLLPGGTAAMTDVGMCGSRDGIIGRDSAAVLQGCITAMPCKYPIGDWPTRVSGAMVEIDSGSGRALNIQAINKDYDR